MTSYVLGLDLGQTSDFTALAVLERHPMETPAEKPEYALRHLKRFPLGTAYTEIVPTVGAVRRSEPLREAPLIVDQTGVGRAVVDMLRQSACGVIPVTIMGGHATTVRADGSYQVPKKELVTAPQVVMQGRRLQIARSPKPRRWCGNCSNSRSRSRRPRMRRSASGVMASMTILCWQWLWLVGGRSVCRPLRRRR